MAATLWLIKIEFARTPSALAALRSAANKLKLTVTEVQRESRPTVLITRRYRCTYPEEALTEGWALVSEVRKKIGPDCRPVAVVMHPESEPEPMPPAMALSEIGVALNVSRQRAQQLSRQSDFPRPIAKTSNGPIYATADIARYHEARERKNGRATNGNVTFPKVVDIRC